MNGITAEAIRDARESVGWSIAQAARALKDQAAEPLPAVDSLIRSWKRWESGVTPSRFYRPLLVSVLRLEDVAGMATQVDLSGDWWAAWESARDTEPVLAVQPVRFTQRGDRVQWQAMRRGRPVEQGGYLWRGELRLWDNEILMGWYAAEDGSVRSKGTVYLVLHPQGQQMSGRWVGLSWDGDTVTGRGVVARSEQDAGTVLRRLIDDKD